MISATNGTTTAIYTYDPLGRRVKKDVDALFTLYLSDGAEEILEYDGNGIVTRRYVFGPGVDEPVVMYETATTEPEDRQFYRADPQGSIIAVTDNNGVAIKTFSYDAYGNPDDPSGQPIRYTGRHWDAETGLYYYRARYYNPALGRFLQTDPIGYGDNVNLYGYVRNDPMNSVDPRGLCRIVNDKIEECEVRYTDTTSTTEKERKKARKRQDKLYRKFVKAAKKIQERGSDEQKKALENIKK